MAPDRSLCTRSPKTSTSKSAMKRPTRLARGKISPQKKSTSLSRRGSPKSPIKSSVSQQRKKAKQQQLGGFGGAFSGLFSRRNQQGTYAAATTVKAAAGDHAITSTPMPAPTSTSTPISPSPSPSTSTTRQKSQEHTAQHTQTSRSSPTRRTYRKLPSAPSLAKSVFSENQLKCLHKGADVVLKKCLLMRHR